MKFQKIVNVLSIIVSTLQLLSCHNDIASVQSPKENVFLGDTINRCKIATLRIFGDNGDYFYLINQNTFCSDSESNIILDTNKVYYRTKDDTLLLIDSLKKNSTTKLFKIDSTTGIYGLYSLCDSSLKKLGMQYYFSPTQMEFWGLKKFFLQNAINIFTLDLVRDSFHIDSSQIGTAKIFGLQSKETVQITITSDAHYLWTSDNPKHTQFILSIHCSKDIPAPNWLTDFLSDNTFIN